MSYKEALLAMREQLFNPTEEPVQTVKKGSGIIAARAAEKPMLKEANLPVYSEWLKEISNAAADIKNSSKEGGSFASGFAQGISKGVADVIEKKTENKGVAEVPEENKEVFIKRRGDLPSSFAPKPSKADSFKDLIDIHEGGGNYDTLFQHSQRDGMPFSDVKVSQMTLGEVKAFASKRGSGSYYQWSKDNMPDGLIAKKKGLGSTPMGRYQFIGTTLKEVANEMGLSDDTVFSPEVQDAMFEHYLAKKISMGKTVDEKIAQVRSAWEGFKNVDDATLANLVIKYGA